MVVDDVLTLRAEFERLAELLSVEEVLELDSHEDCLAGVTRLCTLALNHTF